MSYIKELKRKIKYLEKLEDKRKFAIGKILRTYGEKPYLGILNPPEIALSYLINAYEREWNDLNENNNQRREATLKELNKLLKAWSALSANIDPNYDVIANWDKLSFKIEYTATGRKRKTKEILNCLHETYTIICEIQIIYEMINTYEFEQYVTKLENMNALTHIKESYKYASKIINYFNPKVYTEEIETDEAINEAQLYFFNISNFIIAYERLCSIDIL